MTSLIRLHSKILISPARLTLSRYRTPLRQNSSTPPYARPGPPPLPAKEQQEFEELVRRAQLPAAAPSRTEAEAELQLHPDARRPLEPDFEGETNPTTGEIGGPKKDPLKWGAAGEWTYGGRATDF